ncbi:hypothetical protein HYPSUDRAFT_40014 [Hypholoma sublateritium FD-334 SS-4]|uniref:Uncharacterized protein n=1 Tax=Hypholoma sublateritium (strain FD-334 SS-4) TaxID=945553 RepID=A0A0D2L7U7_HYPSF|nr:hypothetical protein HYPSUDRAFT_40014 [Hypholoma sublateritium FD-334 SS-4]
MSSPYTKAHNDAMRKDTQPESSLRNATSDASDMDSDTAARTAAENLRNSTYGHSHSDRDNTRSGFGGLDDSRGASKPESTPSEIKDESGLADDIHGRNAGAVRDAFDSGTRSHQLYHGGAGSTSAPFETGQSDSFMGIPSTGVNSGAGIHAQQYRGRDAGVVFDDETQRHGDIHHDSTHHATESGQPSCVTCADKGHHTSSHNIGHHTSGHTMSTSQAPSFGGNESMGYGSRTAGAGSEQLGTSQTSSFGGIGHGSQAVGTGAQGTRMGTGFKEGGDESYGSKVQGTGKLSVTDKFMGGVEKTAGKVTRNVEMESHGAAREAGSLGVTKN